MLELFFFLDFNFLKEGMTFVFSTESRDSMVKKVVQQRCNIMAGEHVFFLKKSKTILFILISKEANSNLGEV